MHAVFRSHRSTFHVIRSHRFYSRWGLVPEAAFRKLRRELEFSFAADAAPRIHACRNARSVSC
eukprot:3644930-Pleurochrysis_carterae.AAC.1